MNQLIVTTNQTPIEVALGIDENGMTTARKLYEFLELDPRNYARWCKMNIIENDFAEDGQDFYSSQMTSEGRGNFAQDYKLSSKFAKKLSMTAKNEKGEQAREYFVRTEDKLKEVAIQVSELPPEMQMFKSIFDQQAKQYIEMQQLKADNQEVIKKVESIREVVALDTTSWREDTGTLLRKIGAKLGGGKAYQEIRIESYKLLDKRMGVDISTRLTNLKNRMAGEGVSKSKRDSMSNLDVIERDKKLIEGYTAIVKEMAIKYGVA